MNKPSPGIPSPLRIALVSDTHETRDPAKAAYRQHYDTVIATVNAANVDFVLLAGDLTDDGQPEQYDDAKTQLARFTAPVGCVPGNHDVGDKCRDSAPGVGFDAARQALYTQKLGPSFWAETLASGARVVGINTSLLGSGLPEEAEQWHLLEQELGAADDAWRNPLPLVVVQHYPLFDKTPDEPSDPYWNVEPLPRKRLMALLAAARPRVRAVLSGHLHRPLAHTWGGIRLIGTPPVSFGLPFGVQPEGWTLVSLTPPLLAEEGKSGGIETSFVPVAALPEP